MQYIDERVIFDFSDVTSNYEGVYRYDVLIDSTTIFVGNTFVEINTKPVIDITEILRNYYDTNIVYSSTPTKSNIIREVSVSLYNRNQTDEETITDKIVFIYRQPNYNSLVSTPVIDDLGTHNIATMPMLQGWFHNSNQGYFLPTYPSVSTNNLTFDFVCGYQNLPMINSFSVNYENGLVDNPHYVSIAGSGVYQYSLPLDLLLRGIETTQSRFEDARNILKNIGYWSARYPINPETGVNSFELYSYSISKIDNSCSVTVGNATVELTQTINDNSQKVWVGEIEISEDNNPLDSSFDITIYFNNGSNTTSHTNLQIKDEYNAQLLANGSYKLHFYIECFEEVGSSNPYWTIVNVSLEVIENVTIPICAAVSIDITTFSPVISTNRYSYKIANLDSNSRYFLKWRDRYGMPQIQPFKGTYTYSENTKKSTITNYQYIKKITDVSVNGKWKLNTDWISERLYPFYESIFVSPWLQLYDAKEDKLYSVILTDTEYTEKTFKNQNRSLFNLQLEVELDSTQTIIY